MPFFRIHMRTSNFFTVLQIVAASLFCGLAFDRLHGQSASSSKVGLIPNASLERASADERSPAAFEMVGDVSYGYLSTAGADVSGWGIRLHSGKDLNQDGAVNGSVTTTITNLPQNQRWFRLRIYGLAQDGFAVKRDQLSMQVSYFKNSGGDSLDSIKKQFYPQIERERVDLKDAGTNKNLGLAMWRFYDFDFRTPFPEVDTLRVGVSFAEGSGIGESSEMQIDAIELFSIPEPESLVPGKSQDVIKVMAAPIRESLVKLGGRWYFDPNGGDKKPPAQFDQSNVNQLYYDAGRMETPFANNTTTWMRQGWLDRAGKTVENDRFVNDSVLITVNATHVVIRTKCLPNHPTATFPDRWRALDGDPNYIQEKDLTFHLPLEPQQNPAAIAMSEGNKNRALNGGPIGVAINGVVFFNPFDEGAVDALWRLDRCCGHPSPNEMYHYHKYPVCLNTPWADDGEGHSSLIGFAFDGFPIYGPYENKGLLAKDDTSNPLNEFNVHQDDLRGWHYHVTPGRFPHVIGGYWGNIEGKNVRRGPRQ